MTLTLIIVTFDHCDTSHVNMRASLKSRHLGFMISQSVPLLAILPSSLTLTCLSLIKSTLYPNLVIFISETSVEFVIFLVLQPQLLQIHLSPANLTTVIHYIRWHFTSKSQLISMHWHVSLQTLQNINTSHQHSKNYNGFQSNKEIERIDYKLSAHIQNSENTIKSNQQPTYLYIE